MRIVNLKLLNFRNYNHLTLSFSPNINVIYGKNGSGKTNLIEAIYVLGLTKSFRSSTDKVLVMKDKNLTWIESEQIIFAWLDKDNQVTPLTDEQLNPVWKILNYETGKYESVQKHFRVFEV